jgi:hypothetical protein
MAGAQVIKTIVASFHKTTAIREWCAAPLPWFGFATGPKTSPHLHGLDPANATEGIGYTELQDVVGGA